MFDGKMALEAIFEHFEQSALRWCALKVSQGFLSSGTNVFNFYAKAKLVLVTGNIVWLLTTMLVM